MSVLIDQLNTDNDVLYMIGDIVTKFKKETDKNKQVYNGIVDDLNYVFETIDDKKFTIFQFHSFVNRIAKLRRSRHQPVTRLHNLFSGYKFRRRRYNRVRYPMEINVDCPDYIGCSYIRIHLINKLPRAVKNYAQFFHIRRYQYEVLRDKVRRDKAGIQGWYDCQYKLY